MMISKEQFSSVDGVLKKLATRGRIARRLTVMAAAVTIGAIMTAGPTDASTSTFWSGTASNDFSDSANWTFGVPSESNGYIGRINTVAPNAADVLSNETVSVYTLALGTNAASGSLTIDGTLNIAQPTTSNNSNALSIGANPYTGSGAENYKSLTLDSGGYLNLDSHSEMRLGNGGMAEFNQIGGQATFGNNVEMGVTATTNPSVAKYNMENGYATFDSKLGIAKGNDALFNQSGGTVDVKGAIVLGEGNTSGIYGKGTYQISGGTLNAEDGIVTGSTNVGEFAVDGSTASAISTKELVLSAIGSVLKFGLDANGSTLINDGGNLTLDSGTILDINSLAGFTGSGNVAGDPGWYRLASVAGTLTDSGITLRSDTGLNYALVNDPGYLTVQVTAVPDPGSLSLLGGGVMCLLGLALLRGSKHNPSR